MFKSEIDDSLTLSLLETKDADQLFRLIDSNRDHMGSG